MPKPILVGKPKNTEIPFSDRKLEVLRAAASQFHQKGFHNANMDDIAGNLSVSRPALYYYAKSKDELLYEVIEFAFIDTKNKIEIIEATSQSGAKKLKTFFSVWFEMAISDFGRCLIQSRSNALEKNTQKKNAQARRQLQDKVHNFVELGIEDGSLRSIDPNLTALGLFDLINGAALWFDPKGTLTIDQVFEHQWKLAMNGLSIP